MTRPLLAIWTLFSRPSEQYLNLKNIKATGSEADHRRLALAYLRGAIQTNTSLLARMQGDPIATPVLTALTPDLPSATPPHRATENTGITLYSLFEYWRDAVKGRPARTVEDFERRVKQMDELTGHKPADQLVKADFVNFRDAMLAKGKATTTVEKDLSFLKTIMRYAHESDKIPQNPTAGIKVSQRKVSQSPQRELDPADVAKLFNSPIYTEQARPQGGGRDAAAWLPLLSFYTGARLDELCQLRVEDIQQQGGIQFMRIIYLDDEAAGVKTHIKTDESRRRVPTHPALIQAGFLDYVAHIKARKEDWLFPHLNPDRYGKRGGNWGKWWARWRTRLGVCGRQKCYHAFRHNFKSACRDLEIREDLHDALTGHSGGGIGRDYGTFSLKALDTAMRKLHHDGFEFDWVWQPSGQPRPVLQRKRVSLGVASELASRNPPRLLTRKTKSDTPKVASGTVVYFDTEFSNLTKSAQLISLGAVASNGEAFYVEIDPRPEHCSAFVMETVIPLLTGPKLSTQAFIESFTGWLAQFNNPVLLTDNDWDVFVVLGLVEGRAHRRAGPLELPEPVGRKTIMMTIPPLAMNAQAAFDPAVEQYFNNDPRQHHALVDAHALRAGILATEFGK